MEKLDFEEAIKPFIWNREGYNSPEWSSVTLDFEVDVIEDEAFMDEFGTPLALKEFARMSLIQNPKLYEIIEFDTHGSNVFEARSKDEGELKKFILAFRNMLDGKLKQLAVLRKFRG